ncbi:hypothetical protein AYL99_08180 [Fonsecaea erecta]|uniref:DUF6593 domain-containing protein n=1 Tax=Fonsecaea erecta TaxID=1367422 RepID=A0A178ZCQ4_9EURO|nr:hypothetical protein AYL99_08180 [Fonsecaea erecta]OAP57442.1 hypothetical protein AYL99_08180 [Fonsecaea erecta]
MKSLFKRHQEKEVSGSDLVHDEDETWNGTETEQSFQSDITGQTPESRIVHVQYQDYWNQHTTIRLLDTDQTTVMYTVEARYRKPQMTIRSNASNAEVATVDFHVLTTRIDMRLHGQPLSLDSSGLLKTHYSYASQELHGEKMTWRPRKKIDDLNMVLLDGQGLAMARYKPNYKGLKRGGTLELLSPCWRSDAVLEEVIVMFLAVMHYKECLRMNAAIASGTA